MAKQRKILKSWKDIASYLGVGIRTAQRWKRERDLPVQQPAAKSRSAVLAIPEEIDKWLRASGQWGNGDAEQFSVPDILITDALWTRQSRPKQLEREIEALLDLGRLMASGDRRTILSRIANYALALCRAESAGFSIVETTEDGREVFRWTATRGRMQPFEGGTTPSNFSPCGFCLERNSPQLFRYPEKHYTYLEPIAPIGECLLIPLYKAHAWLGTIWVICHQGRRKFDREDARLMDELGSLATAALLAPLRQS